MGSFRHREAVAGVICCALFGGVPSSARVLDRPAPDTWSAAVAARQAFEAEPTGTHTRPEYARVMDGFRAIYHGNPRDAHAARAAEQVAELLAEQGREFNDRKSLHDAAGQYIFVAHSYPGGTRASEALLHAADLLGPQGANDPAQARAVRDELASDYPQDAARAADAPKDASIPKAAPTIRNRVEDTDLPLTQPSGTQPTATRVPAVVPVRNLATAGEQPVRPTEVPVTADTGAPPAGARAEVTGIRHWSTSSYTRVAIDLGGEVRYQAARVESPDRIFFDLHHAKLAPQLAGKSFTVTDDGFLTRIRAAQFSDDVTRVVLDVHEVTEYSAFLLPNPYRLIIDIHGKQEGGSSKQEVAKSAEQPAPAGPRTTEDAPLPAPTVPAPTHDSTTQSSNLPPMPVTDGSAVFGLPSRSTSTVASVAAPRVVIPSKPTSAKPVPNSVSLKSEATGSEVAAVSRQSGKVEATAQPTSAPIVARSKAPPTPADSGLANGSSKSAGDSEIAAIARSDHYRKPSRAGSSAPSSNSRAAAAPSEAPPPTSDGETSLTRALGLKIGRIVIDAGHGGHDSGTLGADGIEEKDVVLDVALRLGKLLHDRLGAEIVYTRADDTFIPLETRTAIANKAQADLFISVHANSSPDASARGVEVYYLNFTSDPDAMRVASRENAVSTQSVHELSDLVKKIALKDKIEESRELASDVNESLYAGLAKGNDGLKNRGVKKAPFVVLIGANMPSILAEISFVTNPTDADELSRPRYRERVAESIYTGVARYAGAINGSKPKPGTTERAQR